MSRVERIQKELGEMSTKPPPLCTAGPSRGNVNEWNASIIGPPMSPYQGGMFKLVIKFPNEYPQLPPDVTFTTKLYHLNIAEDGYICLDILDKNRKWNPSISVGKILQAICVLLSKPNPDDPNNFEKAQLFLNNRIEYSKLAQDWTQKYAK